MRSLRPILASLAVIAAAASWWLAQESESAGPASEESYGPREVDYFITGLDVVRMTEAGIPAHRLHSAQLRHFTDDQTSELATPHLTVYQDDAPPWEVDSQRAWVSADGSLILLEGEVLIERAGDADDRPLQIVTRNLRVQPGEDYAETDERVRVRSETDWTDSVGMQAWMRPPSRVKLLSQVKGYYVPR